MTALRWTLGPDTRRCTETVLVQFGIFGRAPRNGIGVLDALQANGYGIRVAMVGGEPFRGTVAEFCQLHTSGRFYLATDGHAMALVDGLLVDSSGRGPDGRAVIGAFLVQPVSSAA